MYIFFKFPPLYRWTDINSSSNYWGSGLYSTNPSGLQYLNVWGAFNLSKSSFVYMLVGPLLFHASLMVPSGFTALYEAIAGIATVPTAILTARIKTAKRFFIAKFSSLRDNSPTATMRSDTNIQILLSDIKIICRAAHFCNIFSLFLINQTIICIFFRRCKCLEFPSCSLRYVTIYNQYSW